MSNASNLLGKYMRTMNFSVTFKLQRGCHLRRNVFTGGGSIKLDRIQFSFDRSFSDSGRNRDGIAMLFFIQSNIKPAIFSRLSGRTTFHIGRNCSTPERVLFALPVVLQHRFHLVRWMNAVRHRDTLIGG